MTKEESSGNAKTLALSHIGGLSYVVAEITDRHDAERVYRALENVAMKISAKFDFQKTREKEKRAAKK